MPTQESTQPVTDRDRSDSISKNNKQRRDAEDLRESQDEMEQATTSSEDAMEKLVPAWINASRAFIPAAVYNPWQALSSIFDAQQHALTLQRKFWGEMLNQSQDALSQMNDQRRAFNNEGRSRS